jgi:hypothetical protein
LPLQQPLEQEVALHTHWPLLVLQAWPDAQEAQLAPFVPQELYDSAAQASHVPSDLQQPLGHEVASQTHCPVVLLHSWPDGHAAHVAPLAPHEVFDSLESASHVPPVQHPAHDAPPHAHAPVTHACPELHALHDAPPVPHSELVCEAYKTHVLPLQQPLWHDVPLHTHVPVVVLHAWFDAHAAQVAPPVPHEGVDCEA